ncbi:hypothetical protein [Pelagovum pacificum]|uniref:Uncharacterized protein n=1 Tax=Pelagovum pacificum TaxID=2588711 RepID=A0A5C5GGQ8_9RHOB|nr:hypothetical protein [Pelagovum pacificum]QQA42918.1 hypothetical protein I8N54_19455 [Pelagovum pacificum]TNY33938.1 hypothetical protein FHY64_11935 [Pelagovum pacificum]
MIRFLFAALFCAGPAFAQCPDPSQLDAEGITIAFDDGAIVTYQRLGPDLVLEMNDLEFDTGFGGVYRFGMLPVEEFDLDESGGIIDDSRWVTSYPQGAPGALPPPSSSVDVPFERNAPGESMSGTITFEALGYGNRIISGCPIATRGFKVRVTEADGSWYEPRFNYFTDYGFSIMIGSSNSAGEEYSYDTEWIE